MRDDVDGDEAMVPRVPNLPPEPSARPMAEHELTGHAVYRSWCRHCVASKGQAHAHASREEGELPEIGIDYGFFGRDKEDVLPILCVKCRNSSTGCMGATVVDRKGASDYASSFLTAFIKSLGFMRIMVRSDNERSLLSLIERVTCNLTGVELVLMTSPEGDHQANGLAEVGVRGIKAPTRILRSQLEQRLGSRIDEKDPLMSWIPRHAANCVSRYRIMDDGRTPDQRRCGKTWKRPVVEFGESVHFRQVGESNALRGGDKRLLRGVYVGHHERFGAAIFLTPDGVKRGTRIARTMEHERWDRVFSATCVGVPWQLRPDQGLVRPVVPEAEAKQGVALIIAMPVVPKVDRRRYVTKRDLVKCGRFFFFVFFISFSCFFFVLCFRFFFCFFLFFLTLFLFSFFFSFFFLFVFPFLFFLIFFSVFFFLSCFFSSLFPFHIFSVFFSRFFFTVFLFLDSAISPPIFMSCSSHTEVCNEL